MKKLIVEIILQRNFVTFRELKKIFVRTKKNEIMIFVIENSTYFVKSATECIGGGS